MLARVVRDAPTSLAARRRGTYMRNYGFRVAAVYLGWSGFRPHSSAAKRPGLTTRQGARFACDRLASWVGAACTVWVDVRYGRSGQKPTARSAMNDDPRTNRPPCLLCDQHWAH